MFRVQGLSCGGVVADFDHFNEEPRRYRITNFVNVTLIASTFFRSLGYRPPDYLLAVEIAEEMGEIHVVVSHAENAALHTLCLRHV